MFLLDSVVKQILHLSQQTVDQLLVDMIEILSRQLPFPSTMSEPLLN